MHLKEQTNMGASCQTVFTDQGYEMLILQLQHCSFQLNQLIILLLNISLHS